MLPTRAATSPSEAGTGWHGKPSEQWEAWGPQGAFEGKMVPAITHWTCSQDPGSPGISCERHLANPQRAGPERRDDTELISTTPRPPGTPHPAAAEGDGAAAGHHPLQATSRGNAGVPAVLLPPTPFAVTISVRVFPFISFQHRCQVPFIQKENPQLKLSQIEVSPAQSFLVHHLNLPSHPPFSFYFLYLYCCQSHNLRSRIISCSKG